MQAVPIPRLRLRITATAETIIRSGHPWLFADSIRAENRPGRLGELAVIFDRHDKFLAIGLFDPESPLRVRVLHTGKPATIDTTWWRGAAEAGVGAPGGIIRRADQRLSLRQRRKRRLAGARARSLRSDVRAQALHRRVVAVPG